MNKISTLITGTAGTAAVEIVNNTALPDIATIQNGSSLIIQIIIAIATLWKMFKKPKAVV